MKLLKLLFKPETFAPMLALTFASGVSVTLVLARIVCSGNLNYSFLIWNLLLAWMPLLFALLACDQVKSGAKPGWRFLGFAGAWLIFFPNAPYIFTDLIHLKTNLKLELYTRFWVDMALILMCAFTGLMIGFVSLYLMQAIVRQKYGRVAGWMFIAAITGLSSFGICIGRFLRFNSWDVLVKPATLARGIGGWVDSLSHPGTIAFPMVFAAFLFTAYLTLYALTHLSPAQQLPAMEK
jgi:uncharacterized membrane protein